MDFLGAISIAIGVAAAIALIIVAIWQIVSQNRKSYYGAANEMHAGLNSARSIYDTPEGWPSFYLPGYRADSSSAISHMMMRD
jgi:hypothetical protein